MSRVKAKYFDGKTSKPQTVYVERFKRDIVFYETEDSLNVIHRWPIILCKTEQFNHTSGLQVSYGEEFPKEQLEINEPSQDLIDSFSASEVGEKYLFDKVLKGNATRVIFFGILILGIMIYSYINWVSVIVGNAIVSIIPQNIEESIGDNAFNQYYAILDLDSSKSKLLDEFYKELGYDSPYKIDAYLDESDMVNAFALPGGKIVVYEGLVDRTQSWKELAALFSHEVSHINNRHSMRLMSRQLGNYAVFSAITGDMAGISSVMIESAISLHDLVNSRKYETEADEFGLRMMLACKIDPKAMIGLFERLHEENKEVDEFMENLEVLNTHPLTQKRIQFIEDWVDIYVDDSFIEEENPRAEEIWRELKGIN